MPVVSSHLLPTYSRVDLAFERGEGAWLITAEGKRYLDFTSGVAVNALGHAHPHMVAAITAQAQKLWHTSNLYRIPEGEKLAERLCALSFAELRDRHSSVIAEVRGEGLLIGLRMVPPVAEMVDELRNEEMITVAAGDNVVRLLPPLIIGDAEISEAIARIDRACVRLEQAHPRQGAA